ncbi:MAG: hypothetical protein KAW92_13685, partial [Candidatus Cloacimonetes bacterium]|nr:hypothetical protein [Candidatus Cloacimonadota bacterium]
DNWIEKITTLSEGKEFHDIINIYIERARQVKISTAGMNEFAERKFIVERKMGKDLIRMAKTGEREIRGGDKKSKLMSSTLKLSDLGINKDQSFRYQLLSRLPVDKFNEYIINTKKKQEQIAWTELRNITKKYLKETEKEKVNELRQGQ